MDDEYPMSNELQLQTPIKIIVDLRLILLLYLLNTNNYFWRICVKFLTILTS